MTTKPVTDAEVDAALRITVHSEGCFTTSEVTAMRQALEQFAQSRAAEVVGAVQFGWRIPTILSFKDCDKWPGGALRTSCPPEHRESFEGTVAYHVEMFCDTPEDFVTDKHGVKHYPTPLYTAPPSTAPKAQDDLAGAETEHGIAHSLAGFRGGFMSEHGRWPTEQEIWNHAIRSWRDLNPSQPKAPAPVLVAQVEAMALNNDDFWFLENAACTVEDAGKSGDQDADYSTRQAARLREIKNALFATPPGGAGGDVVAVTYPFTHNGSKIVRKGHASGLLDGLAKWMERDDVGDSSTMALVSAYIKHLESATPAAEQANPDHLGSGASGGVPTDAERLRFIAHSPSRYVERHPTNGMWRVYEDKAPATAIAANWVAMTIDYHATPRMAIDAALSSTVGRGE